MTTTSKWRKLPLLALVVLFLNGGCGILGVVVTDGGGSPAPGPGPRTYPSYRSLNIPPGHLPPPGQCRIWYPGKPPGHQPPPTSCEAAWRDVAPGAWVLYRPTNDQKTLEVKEKQGRHPKIEVVIKHYAID